MQSSPASQDKKLTKRQRRLLNQTVQQIDAPVFKSHFRMQHVKPLTENQQKAMAAYEAGENLLLHGLAGTGKTFLALAMALQDVMAGDMDQRKISIVRSAVPTRDIGFLPGSAEEKMAVYEAPYIAICTELFGRGDAYGILKTKGLIEFIPTSFVRGMTLRDTIVILDEVNNCTFHEIDSVVTRLGENCRLLICGDMRQSDLTSDKDKQGLLDFIKILNRMKSFEHIEFDEEDIVRSELVKQYILAKDRYFREK